MTTVVAFIVGMKLSGIVVFFVCACIVAEHRYDARKVWEDGYTAGYTDGIKGKVAQYDNGIM